MKFLKGLFITILVIIGLVVVVFIIGVNSESEPVEPQKELTKEEKIAKLEEQIKYQTDYTWSADNILKQFDENSIKAEEDFKGKVYHIKGFVKDVGKDIMGKPYIVIGNSRGMGSVQCMFDKNKTKQLAELKKGNEVVVKGKIFSKMMYVMAEDCELVYDVPALKEQLKELKK
ncbi:MAG: hypothetical protein JXR60_05990 [Bacteroidales bacterium]|nr:hypothetical protein [Bacteroidales bacterium]